MKYVDKTFLGYNVMLALAASGVLLWIFATANNYARAIDDQSRSARIAAQADRALSRLTEALLDAETGQRGFLLTQDAKYLAPFLAAEKKANADIDEFRTLLPTLGPTATLEGEQNLRRLVIAKFDELSQTIESAQNGDASGAQALVRNGVGAQLMEQIRSLIAAARAETTARRQRYSEAMQKSAQKLRETTFAGMMAIIFLSILAIATITWHTRQLIRARQALREANAQLENRVRERTQQLIRSNEEIQRYAYIVSHDLRAPLVNIMGFTRELENAISVIKTSIAPLRQQPAGAGSNELAVAVDEDIPEALRFIHSSLKRMDSLISEILKLSRLGRATLRSKPINMAKLVEGCIFQIRHRLDECGGQVSVQPPLPNIVSDQAATQQIFTNLLDNAVKYFAPGRAGRIVVAGWVQGERAIFEVRDNGRGVEPHDMERIFELFRRSGAQDQPGEGIGLAHVRTLVRRLGGEIEVVSDGSSGTTFRFSLHRDLRGLLNDELGAGKAADDEGRRTRDDRDDRGR